MAQKLGKYLGTAYCNKHPGLAEEVKTYQYAITQRNGAYREVPTRVKTGIMRRHRNGHQENLTAAISSCL